MQVGGDWLTSDDTQAVLGMLNKAGYQAYCVGGCVRNALLGVEVADVDIATDALPEEVEKLAKKAGLHPVPTGIDHGTITVVCNHEPFEVTTFRKDVDTDGRRAVVSYSTSMADDAIRRDFTVNALYVEADGTLHDPRGRGLDDIKERRIRFIEDAAKRIEEDYLRILRFFRFYAWYGDPEHGLDGEGFAACATHIDGLSKLSKERVGAEMKKLLAAPDPAPALAAMAACGALAQILPGSDPQFIAPMVHLENELGVGPSWKRRLYAMGGEHPSKLMRLSRVESQYYNSIQRALGEDYKTAVLGYVYGEELALDISLIKAATLGQPLPSVDLVTKEPASAHFERSDVCVIPAAGVIGECCQGDLRKQNIFGRSMYLRRGLI